jgi:hypothetical protein
MRADRFLRTAEPQAHNKWTMTPDLKAHYMKGGKAAIDNMFNAVRKEIGELVRPPAKSLDEGPQSLKELLRIGDDVLPPPEGPRVYRPNALPDAEERWVVDARIRVRPDPDTSWKFEPVVVFEMETGGGQPVEWAELEALSGCSLEDGRLVMAPDVNEARFRGVTNKDSHPIVAIESAIHIELRKVESVRRTGQ